MRGVWRCRVAPLLLALCLAPAQAEGWLEHFRDPQDGQFDMSEWLLDHKGFLPVPIIITEPAVGYGGGAALVFFSESLRDTAARSKGGHRTPPDVFAVAAAAH